MKLTVLLDSPGLVVRSMEMTCGACPSQRDAVLGDGRPAYIRFRHGYGAMRVAAIGENAVSGDEVLVWESDHELDGCMSEAQLRELFPDVRWPV